MPIHNLTVSLRVAAILVAWAACVPGVLANAAADPAGDLRARYTALSQQLETSSIQRGLYLDSNDNSRAPRGDAYAVVDYPFATVAAAFDEPANLCESLILHLNVQYCQAIANDAGPQLSAAVGKKTNQPLEDTHRINFVYKVAVLNADYTRVELSSTEGPFDTANYLIVLELVALDEQRAFLHLRYSSCCWCRTRRCALAHAYLLSLRGSVQEGVGARPLAISRVIRVDSQSRAGCRRYKARSFGSRA